jgi:lipoprotein NlpI
MQGKYADAMEQFDAAIQIDPSNEIAKKNRDQAAARMSK